MISTFSFPTRIVAGEGALATLPAELAAAGLQRPLIVTDPGLLTTAAWESLRRSLGHEPIAFSGVHPNPLEADVFAAAEAYHAGGCDGVIGFGGGSALDVAKIVRAAVVAPAGAVRWPDLTWEHALGPLPPFIAIPTTAGTGSEVGRSSVIIFGQTKRVIFHPALLARVVLLEPLLTAGLPPRLTAATGVDALTHCLEAATSPVFHPLCDGLALKGARLVFAHLAQAVEHGGDLHARLQMQIAATMGGIAFQKDLGAAPLPFASAFRAFRAAPRTGQWALPATRHAAECQAPAGVYARLARATEQGSSDAEFIAAVESLLARIGLGGGLRPHGVREESLPLLAAAGLR